MEIHTRLSVQDLQSHKNLLEAVFSTGLGNGTTCIDSNSVYKCMDILLRRLTKRFAPAADLDASRAVTLATIE